MKIDNLKKLYKLCAEKEVNADFIDENTLAIGITNSGKLIIKNIDNISLIGFDKFKWHAHDKIMFSDGNNYIELDYLQIIDGLKSGYLLIVDEMKNGVVIDRYLIHKEYNDLFESLNENTEVRIRRFY